MATVIWCGLMLVTRLCVSKDLWSLSDLQPWMNQRDTACFLLNGKSIELWCCKQSEARFAVASLQLMSGCP